MDIMSGQLSVSPPVVFSASLSREGPVKNECVNKDLLDRNMVIPVVSE